MSKVQKLTGILALLIIVSAALFYFDGEERDSFDRSIFAIEDTASVSSIVIQGPQGLLQVQRQRGGWQLNDTLLADPALIKVVFSIMQQVRVQRPVSQLNLERIQKSLRESGQKISVVANGETNEWYAGGDLSKSQAYFGDESLSQVYLVGIPGYNHYVSGVFELTPNQWRDRLLFDSNFRSLQELNISYADGESLKIDFEDRFFKVNALEHIDTTQLMTYINGLEKFQLNDYLTPGDYPRYDSLAKTMPVARLILRDIDERKNRDLEVYAKIPGERFYLLTNRSGDRIVVDQERLNSLLVTADYFQMD
ncbi:hypothetical protein BFP72_11810 [Reichenbachiella sp. 5M10]|uniref:hypothetical protein n=1 Tax=Reichenbachiella sp. 5M10 TaxID=1889772 RepID=UPI000C148962|nr:hypothetical protein [Reichenbachiella sp. 5M10]PIB36032.1 hypothetical protein BFP72_11810 [Reichenbachiella sp. 5M10]